MFKQNLSFGNVVIRYIVGIHFVIAAGLLQWLPLVPVAIGLMFTCISGWDPIVALMNAGIRNKAEVRHVTGDDEEDLKAVA